MAPSVFNIFAANSRSYRGVGNDIVNIVTPPLKRNCRTWQKDFNTRIAQEKGAYLFFLAIVFGFNPASTAYWTTLLILPLLFFPTLNTFLHPKKETRTPQTGAEAVD